MKYDVVISEEAHNDIDNVLGYIVNSLKNPTAAKNLLEKIENIYISLEDSPLMYSYCADSRLQKQGYRKAVINNYVLIYRIDKARNVVYIVRFFYGRQNYIKLI